MKKRNRILVAVVVVAVAGGLAWVGLREPPEPVYQGKTLTKWLEECGSTTEGNWTPLPDGTKHDRADFAIKEMGSNAIPSLLNMLGTTPSPLILNLQSWLSHIASQAGYHSRIKLYRHSAYERQEMAFIGIEALGTNAKPCIPAMTEYLKRESEFYITGGYTWTRFHGRAILYKLAPNSDFFRSANSRYWALYAILASDREIANRLSALETLRRMAEKGEELSGATYSIKSALTDEAIQVRIAATNALKQIDPEAASKAGMK